MKTIVSVNEIDELEIKPQAELLLWKQISREEIESRWKSSAELHEVNVLTVKQFFQKPGRQALNYIGGTLSQNQLNSGKRNC
jgi:hypothetical protein